MLKKKKKENHFVEFESFSGGLFQKERDFHRSKQVICICCAGSEFSISWCTWRCLENVQRSVSSHTEGTWESRTSGHWMCSQGCQGAFCLPGCPGEQLYTAACCHPQHLSELRRTSCLISPQPAPSLPTSSYFCQHSTLKKKEKRMLDEANPTYQHFVPHAIMNMAGKPDRKKVT